MGLEPELTRAEGLTLETYEVEAGDDAITRLYALLDQKAYLGDRVRAKAATTLLYRQPSIPHSPDEVAILSILASVLI